MVGEGGWTASPAFLEQRSSGVEAAWCAPCSPNQQPKGGLPAPRAHPVPVLVPGCSWQAVLHRRSRLLGRGCRRLAAMLQLLLLQLLLLQLLLLPMRRCFGTHSAAHCDGSRWLWRRGWHQALPWAASMSVWLCSTEGHCR